jgi:tripartite-type tricarboxylate transporter receptor subunit TctC
VGPKGIPSSIVAALNKEFVALWRDPKFVAFLKKQAVLPAAGSVEEFVDFLKQDRSDSETLVRLANPPKSDFEAGK